MSFLLDIAKFFSVSVRFCNGLNVSVLTPNCCVEIFTRPHVMVFEVGGEGVSLGDD